MEHLRLVKKYFPEISAGIADKLVVFCELFTQWNQKINLVSRKDIVWFEERHLLHSLAILKTVSFKPGTRILDVGTGGGLPGLPLAICFPEVSFVLADSIGKKIEAVQSMSQTLDLRNVKAVRSRAEAVDGKFDFVVSRAVTRLPEFVPWVADKIKSENRNSLPNGILYLKGGELSGELQELSCNHAIYPISVYFDESFFETKHVVHLYGRLRTKSIPSRSGNTNYP